MRYLQSGGEARVILLDERAVHQQQPLRDGAAAAVELVLAAVAVALHELAPGRLVHGPAPQVQGSSSRT